MALPGQKPDDGGMTPLLQGIGPLILQFGQTVDKSGKGFGEDVKGAQGGWMQMIQGLMSAFGGGKSGTGSGGLLGMLGTAVGGPVGGMIGGVLGGIFGLADGGRILSAAVCSWVSKAPSS